MEHASRQQFELNHIVQVDTTSFSKGEFETGKYYVISTKWLEDWVDYVQLRRVARPGLIYNEILMENESPNGSICKPSLQVKKDYRLVNFKVWDMLSTWYGTSGPTISIESEKAKEFTNTNNWSIYVPPNQKLHINLVPHVHSLTTCNRKQFVCDTAGTYREREKVRYCYVDGSKDINITWYRGKMKENYDFNSLVWETCFVSTRDESGSGSKKIDSEEGNNYTYQIRLEDDQHYLKVESNDSNFVSNVVGPCDIQTPFCQDVFIVGNPIVGNVLKARAVYWGGFEGPSEYSWIRLTNGKREKFPSKARDPSVPFDELRDDSDDIRCYKIKEKDVGSKLKVQISPVRSDGLRGESKTSKACKVLNEADNEEASKTKK